MNPFAPTMHFNYRYFETETPKGTSSADNWNELNCCLNLRQLQITMYDYDMCHSLQMLLVHLDSGGLEVVLTWRLRISLKRMSGTFILYVNNSSELHMFSEINLGPVMLCFDLAKSSLFKESRLLCSTFIVAMCLLDNSFVLYWFLTGPETDVW